MNPAEIETPTPADGRTARRYEFRQRVLDAAEALVRENGDVSFSTRALAERAQVSPATPFNHFGSKRGVLSGIVARSISEMSFGTASSREDLDSIERIFAASEFITSFYADDAELFRPLFGDLIGSGKNDPDQLFAQASASWLKGLQAARAGGRIERGRKLEIIANQLELHWVGTLMSWVARRLKKRVWLARVEYGTALILSNVVVEADRPRLRRRAAKIEKELAAQLAL